MTPKLSIEQQLNITLKLFLLLTVIELINLFTGRQLNHLALVPREFDALAGIFISPFLHGGLGHYLSNIIPICLFSILMLQYGTRTFVKSTLFILVLSGLLVWLLGRSAHHLGASGMVYGYFGFLVYAGFISGRIKLILISLLVGFFYGGLIFGVLPLRAYVSWESHLFGLICGLIAAKLFVSARDESRV